MSCTHRALKADDLAIPGGRNVEQPLNVVDIGCIDLRSAQTFCQSDDDGIHRVVSLRSFQQLARAFRKGLVNVDDARSQDAQAAFGQTTLRTPKLGYGRGRNNDRFTLFRLREQLGRNVVSPRERYEEPGIEDDRSYRRDFRRCSARRRASARRRSASAFSAAVIGPVDDSTSSRIASIPRAWM